MAWGAPRTWITAELVTASLFNAQIRDNMLMTLPGVGTTVGDMAYVATVSVGITATTARVGVGSTGQYMGVVGGVPAFTGTPLLVALGAVGAPAYSFTGDTNTGTWSPAADTYAVSTGGTERVRVDSAGNVGINGAPKAWTSTWRVLDMTVGGAALAAVPAAQLYLLNNTYFDGSWRNTANAAIAAYQQTGGVHQWYSDASPGAAGTAYTPTLRWQMGAAGNLGIMVNAAYLTGVTTTPATVAMVGIAGDNAIKIGGVDLGAGVTHATGVDIDTATNSNISFYVNSSLKMKWDGTTGGLVIGSPTGAAKGDGSINAVTVYRNGTALDKVFTSKYEMLPIPAMRAYYEQHHYLPTLRTQDVHDAGSTDVGALGDAVWETVEVHARYIAELESRIAQLEAR